MPATFPEPSSTSDLIRSTVPSSWTAAGLVNHLANVERRWLRWGFLAEPVLNPWRDQAGAGWLTPDMSADELISLLEQTGRRTRAIVEAMTGIKSDAPLCMSCGVKMRMAGSCFVCEGCGSTSGCS